MGDLIPLAPRTQPGGKVVAAWAVEADYDPRELRSNTFVMEWPKGSGTHAEYPEVDRAEWFELVEARKRILPGQRPMLDELAARIDASSRAR